MHTPEAGILSLVTQSRRLQHSEPLRSHPTLKIPQKHCHALGKGFPACSLGGLETIT